MLDDEAPWLVARAAVERLSRGIPVAALGVRSSRTTEIARIAKTKNTGARGLRSVVDELLFDVMYALPDEEQGRKYVVTPEIVRGVAKLFPRDDSAAA